MILKTNVPIYWSISSVGSIATSVIANEVDKMERKHIFKYSLERSERVKTLPKNHLLNLEVKVKLLLFLTYYFKV